MKVISREFEEGDLTSMEDFILRLEAAGRVVETKEAKRHDMDGPYDIYIVSGTLIKK